jgi:hypothetical protein
MELALSYDLVALADNSRRFERQGAARRCMHRALWLRKLACLFLATIITLTAVDIT